MNERDKLIITIERAKRQSEENGLCCILAPFKETDMILKFLKEQDNCENCAIAIEDRQLVVRCLNCVHWNPGPYTFCRVREGVWTAGEYCSKGLRRADPRPDEEDKI